MGPFRRFTQGTFATRYELEWFRVHSDPNFIVTAGLRWSNAYLVLFLLLFVTGLSGQTHQAPDLSGLTPLERQSVESACSYEKTVLGPAAYYQCVEKQLSTLSGSRKPNTSGLTPLERQSVESACSYEKTVLGPAAYYQCVQKQLGTLSGSRKPDTSALTPLERQSVESACSYEKTVVGPAAYYQCVEKQLEELRMATPIGTSTPASASASAPQTRQPSADIKRLGYFDGAWNLEGVTKTSPLGPGGKFAGIQRFEWAPDHLSLILRWDEQRPTGSDKGTGVYSYDSAQKVYTFHGVDSEGEEENSRGTIEGDSWTWMSSLTIASGETMKGRFTMKITSSTSYNFKFELAPQNGEWATVTEGRATKSK